MKVEANTPEVYLAKVPEERQEVFAKLCDTIRAHLPEGFIETMG